MKEEKEKILSRILDFYEMYVQCLFSKCSDYCFDVYIDKKDRVWLLDFNVWGVQTDSLLFDWEELTSTSVDDTPSIRVVEDDELAVHHDPLASYRAPIDTIDLATMTGGDATSFAEFMALCEKPSERDVDSS